ncbi:MAG: PAS domain-containing protein, partial [Cyclobacteriaceae bacterium]
MEVINKDIQGLKDQITLLKEKLQLKEAEYAELLDKASTQQKNLFNSSADLIQILSPDGSIRFVNQAWKYKLGYYEKEITKLKFNDIIHPQKRKDSLKKLQEITSGVENQKIETILTGKYGRNIYVSGYISCVFENQKPVEYRCIFYDVTARARAESAQGLYYIIAHNAHQQSSLDHLYKHIFNELSSHLQVRNFSIAIKSENEYQFPYRICVNLSSPTLIDEKLSDYTLDREKPLIVYQDGIRKIVGENILKEKLDLPKIWLGVPFSFDMYHGVMMMYSYQNQNTFNHKDLELLDFIAEMVALSLDRDSKKEKIKTQSARLEAIFESSSHQIWSIDRRFRLTSFNRNFENSIVKHFSNQAKTGREITEYFRSHDKDFIRTWRQHYIDAFKGNSSNFQIQTQTLRKETLWQEVFINPIVKEGGVIEEVSIIANDITEKKQAQISIKASEEKFRNIFESFQDIYFRCNLDGVISMVSPSVTEVLGYHPKDLIGKRIDKYFTSKQSNQKLIKKLVQSRNVKNFQGSAKTNTKEEIDFLCNIRLIKNAWGIRDGIEGVARDITQLKKTN